MKRITLFLGIMLTVFAIGISQAAVTKLGTIARYEGISSDTKPSTAPMGSLFKCTDTGIVYEWNGSSWVLQPVRSIQDTITRTAPGDFVAIITSGYRHVTVGIKTASTNTSSTFRFLGKMTSLGGWGNYDSSDSTVITGNKTIFKTFDSVAGLDSFKVEFTSEAGGTSVLPTVKYVLWNDMPYTLNW